MAREDTSHAVPGFPPLPERNRVFPLRAPWETEARLRYKTLQLMSRRHNRTVIARHEAICPSHSARIVSGTAFLATGCFVGLKPLPAMTGSQ